MNESKRQAHICENGHHFYKSSDCRTCPTCEDLTKPAEGFLSSLSAPAWRALISIGITNPEQLCFYTEKDILNLHGIGPTTIPKLKLELHRIGKSFKKNEVFNLPHLPG